MTGNSHLNLRFALTSSSEDVYYDAAEDITEWFQELDYNAQQDYIDTIEEMVTGDIIFLADLHLVLQRWSPDGDEGESDDENCIPVFSIRTH